MLHLCVYSQKNSFSSYGTTIDTDWISSQKNIIPKKLDHFHCVSAQKIVFSANLDGHHDSKTKGVSDSRQDGKRKLAHRKRQSPQTANIFFKTRLNDPNLKERIDYKRKCDENENIWTPSYELHTRIKFFFRLKR